MHKRSMVLAALALAACARDTEYEAGGAIDTTADTARGLDIDIWTTRDTLYLPVFGTEKDTIIVDKPVLKGRRPVEIKRPTVDVNKKP